MRIGEVVSLSTATTAVVLEPFGKAWFHNSESAQAECDFGSVLEYFENLPPIPRTCLAPLAKHATHYCSTFLGIRDVTSYTATVIPKVTELALGLETVLAATTVYETLPSVATTKVLEVHTETITSTRTTTSIVLPPLTTINRVVTITAKPVTITIPTYLPESDSDNDSDRKLGSPVVIDSPFGNYNIINNHQDYKRDVSAPLPKHTEPLNTLPPPPPPRPSPNSNNETPNKSGTNPANTCKSLVQEIFSLPHPPSVLSQACACLQIHPRTIKTEYHPPKSALGSQQLAPIRTTSTSLSTVTKLLSVTSTVLDIKTQSLTQRVTSTRIVAPLVTATFDLCKRGYKGTQQNGVGNRVETLPLGSVTSQGGCCQRCVNTPNCVALAWIPAEPEEEEPEAESDSRKAEKTPVQGTGQGIEVERNQKTRICQLLIKVKPMPGVLDDEEELYASQKPGRGRGGRRKSKAEVTSIAVISPSGASGRGGLSEMCPLGIEEYDFGEEDREGTVFRGPCGVTKGV